MGTSYYFVCRECKKYTPAFYRQAWGVSNCPEMMLKAAKFVAFHTVYCGGDDYSVQIESEHTVEYYVPNWATDDDDDENDFVDGTDDAEIYKNILPYLDELPQVWDDYCKTLKEDEEGE